MGSGQETRVVEKVGIYSYKLVISIFSKQRGFGENLCRKRVCGGCRHGC